MRVVECASIIAAPSSALHLLHLLQLDANVIRILRQSKTPPP
ncbi:hypothetical protein [Burkholderia lata]|nr:hypothetical protein [Burkholderia lata]